jgi:hypothetical protein
MAVPNAPALQFGSNKKKSSSSALKPPPQATPVSPLTFGKENSGEKEIA